MRKCENQRIERGIGGKSSRSFGRKNLEENGGERDGNWIFKKKVIENGKT